VQKAISLSGELLQESPVRYAEGLWRMRRHGPAIAHWFWFWLFSTSLFYQLVSTAWILSWSNLAPYRQYWNTTTTTENDNRDKIDFKQTIIDFQEKKGWLVLLIKKKILTSISSTKQLTENVKTQNTKLLKSALTPYKQKQSLTYSLLY